MTIPADNAVNCRRSEHGRVAQFVGRICSNNEHGEFLQKHFQSFAVGIVLDAKKMDAVYGLTSIPSLPDWRLVAPQALLLRIRAGTKIVSLRAMNEFLGFQFLGSFKLLMDAQQSLSDASKKRAESDSLTAIERGVVRVTLDAAAKECSRIGLDQAVNRIYVARRLTLRIGDTCNLQLMQSELKSVVDIIMHELSKQKFIHIAPAYIAFFEADSLFGKEVDDTFPLAKRDIKDAGNALAAELPAAAVFHAMRVAERGLKALADKLGVKLRYPLETADWDLLINAIRKKIDALSRANRNAKRQAQIRNYTDAARQARFFQDVWRIYASRGAKSIKEHRTIEPKDAIDVVQHVCWFMQDLARLEIEEGPKRKLLGK